MSNERPDINTTEGRIEMIADDVRDTIASGGHFDPGDPEHVYNDTMAIVDGLSSSSSDSSSSSSDGSSSSSSDTSSSSSDSSSSSTDSSSSSSDSSPSSGDSSDSSSSEPPSDPW